MGADLADKSMGKAMAAVTGGRLVITSIIMLLFYIKNYIDIHGKELGILKALSYSNIKISKHDHSTCSRAILGGYRPFSYIGFAVGTIYQYVLLKIMVTVVFADVSPVPEYNFDFKALVITLPAFIIAYELIMYCYSLRIRKLPVKSIMIE